MRVLPLVATKHTEPRIRPTRIYNQIAIVPSYRCGSSDCRATLHVPRKQGPAPAGTVEVTIPANEGISLKAWWLQPETPNGNCVVVLHGIGDSRVGSAGFAPLFTETRYRVSFPIAEPMEPAAGGSSPMASSKNTTPSPGRTGCKGRAATKSLAWENRWALPF